MKDLRWVGSVGLGVAVVLISQAAFGQSNLSPAKLIEEFDEDRDGKLDVNELGKALAGETPEEEPAFLRVLHDAKDVPTSLETSVATFMGERGTPQVDLISAVHLADVGYYEELNRLFRQYDVVLYELIAPEDGRVPQPGHRSRHPVGRLQEGIKSYLDLSFQLHHIDYSAKNLVHADMSPEEFSQSMKDRGESFLQVFFRMMTQATTQSATKKAPSDADFLIALFAEDRSLRMKRLMATQFEDMESQMAVFSGPDGSTLITERNKKAIEVLRRELDRGHDRIAIFYGAGHMQDMAERLTNEFGLKSTGQRWLQAWDLTSK